MFRIADMHTQIKCDAKNVYYKKRRANKAQVTRIQEKMRNQQKMLAKGKAMEHREKWNDKSPIHPKKKPQKQDQMTKQWLYLQNVELKEQEQLWWDREV